LIRPEVVDPKSIAQHLRALRDENLTNLDDVISESVAVSGLSAKVSAKAGERGSRSMAQFLTHYYTEHLRFRFGEAEKRGLQHFAHLCVRYSVLSKRDRALILV